MASDVGFLQLRCWFDEDYVHIWQSHVCVDGKRLTSMLPTIWKAFGNRVEPSIYCLSCGLHAFGHIEVKPDFVSG